MMKPIKIEDITTEKLIEIDDQREADRLLDLTTSALKELAEKQQEAASYLNTLNTEVQMRILRAHSLGVDKKELAKIFNVTTRQITKWIGA
jgi:DNA-directed RNA polymerase specialized sigma24 family protein